MNNEANMKKIDNPAEGNMPQCSRKAVDWAACEIEYRAGIKTLRQLGEEFGVSHTAIKLKANELGWVRDLKAKIHQRAAEIVAMQPLSNGLSKDPIEDQPKPTEKQIVDANAQAIAAADLTNRKDVVLAIDIARSHLEELACLGDPGFRSTLEWIGQVMDKSTETEDGKKVVDKVNETYQYIISLAGRVKMAKDIAASVGTYIPLQRKILRLDADADRAMSGFDALLVKVNAQAA